MHASVCKQAMSSMDSKWHSVNNSEFGGISHTIPPMVGGEDSTVVGILQWSPTGGERLGGCSQGEFVSNRQGMSYISHEFVTMHCILSY